MTAADLAREAGIALGAGRYEEAITKYTQAINIKERDNEAPNPLWLVNRADAYTGTRQYDEALRDAEEAYLVAHERNSADSREHKARAQHRRSVVLRRQERYGDAAACALWAQRLAENVPTAHIDTIAQYLDEKGFYHFTQAQFDAENPSKKKNSNEAGDEARSPENAGARYKASMKSKPTPLQEALKRLALYREMLVPILEALPADDPARKVTVKLMPEQQSLDGKTGEPKKEKHDPEIDAAKAALAQEKPAPKPAVSNGSFRSQTYQDDHKITATLFMKFADKEATEKVSIEFQPNMVAITGVPREPPTSFIIPHAAIDPSKSTYQVLTKKIELNLVKATPGKWPTFGEEKLTKPEGFVSSQPTEPENAPAAPATTTTATDKPPQANKAPAYPTSSKTGPKDWDSFGADDDDDDEGADNGPDDFFRKLYADASPDARRAMMKSFQESNGTTLSTDWKSVSQKTVETQPPDGMQVKKF